MWRGQWSVQSRSHGCLVFGATKARSPMFFDTFDCISSATSFTPFHTSLKSTLTSANALTSLARVADERGDSGLSRVLAGVVLRRQVRLELGGDVLDRLGVAPEARPVDRQVDAERFEALAQPLEVALAMPALVLPLALLHAVFPALPAALATERGVGVRTNDAIGIEPHGLLEGPCSRLGVGSVDAVDIAGRVPVRGELFLDLSHVVAPEHGAPDVQFAVCHQRSSWVRPVVDTCTWDAKCRTRPCPALRGRRSGSRLLKGEFKNHRGSPAAVFVMCGANCPRTRGCVYPIGWPGRTCIRRRDRATVRPWSSKGRCT